MVAQQISCILGAIQQRKEHFVFEGQDIPLNLGCGIFVTMNPGYAGRSELPDNLKALLRPVSMMVPDLTLICEISLLSQGFADSESLARKVTMLFELMDKQLSKQDHYDFTLRNIKAVMVFAGNLKKEVLCGSAGRPENCCTGGGWHGRPAKEGDGVPEMGFHAGPLFCVRTDVATKDAGTQILARKIFFTQKFSPTHV